MKAFKHFTTWLFLALGSIAFVPASAQTTEAPDVLVKRISEEVLEIAKTDPQIKSGSQARVLEVVEEKIFPHVDFRRATTLAVGRHWRTATPEQQDKLANEFRTLLVRTYSSAVGEVKDHRLEYRPLRADPADTDVEVRTQVIQPRGEPIQLNYRLLKTPQGWKIYDVNVMGAWLIESYRNSFATEINKSGIDGLINVLVERNKRLAANPAQSTNQKK